MKRIKCLKKEYYVEAILDERKDGNGTPQFLIKWLGWDDAFNTWEPIDHLQRIAAYVAEFLNQGPHRQPVQVTTLDELDSESQRSLWETESNNSRSPAKKTRSRRTPKHEEGQVAPVSAFQTPIKRSLLSADPLTLPILPKESLLTFGKIPETVSPAHFVQDPLPQTTTSASTTETPEDNFGSPESLFRLGPFSPQSSKSTPSFRVLESPECEEVVFCQEFPNTRGSYASSLFEEPSPEAADFIYVRPTAGGLAVGARVPRLNNLKLETHISKVDFGQFLAALK